MRIGIIAPPWIPIPPDGYGGIESFIDTVACALHHAGHEVLLAASSDSTCEVTRLPGFEPSDPAKMGVTAHELQHLLRAYAALQDVDVILDNTLAGPILARFATRVPVVTVAHGPLIPLEQELYLAGSPDVAYVAISERQASLAGDVPISRVIHHGIRVEDPDKLGDAIRAGMAETSRPTVIDVIVTRDPAKMLPAVDNRVLKVEKGDRPV